MRVYNFSAGPSVLPETVLRRVADEMLDHGGSGMSVMEMSHRSDRFGAILEDAQQRLRDLLVVPDSHHILFLQGGASLQFAMVPLNLMTNRRRADYVNTGNWSRKAIAEAGKFGAVRVAASSETADFCEIPALGPELWDPHADYVHVTTNNTIYGTQYSSLPETGDLTLVADMSSDFLSAPVDVSRLGLAYAGAQKNAGPAGLTHVIIRRDLVGRARPDTPAMLDYATHVKTDSCYNTPPTFAIYVAGLVFAWLQNRGGLAAVAADNREKAELLYAYLDRSQLFRALVDQPHRSRMNIPFRLPDEALEWRFLAEAEAAGLVNLKGHRSVGGMRASLYNAMPREGVTRLVDFMTDYEARALRGGVAC